MKAIHCLWSAVEKQGLQQTVYVCFAGVLHAENCCEEVSMENNVTQISREDLDDLRDAFNKIGQCFFPHWPWAVYFGV